MYINNIINFNNLIKTPIGNVYIYSKVINMLYLGRFAS